MNEACVIDCPSPVDVTAWHLYTGTFWYFLYFLSVPRQEEAGGPKGGSQGWLHEHPQWA